MASKQKQIKLKRRTTPAAVSSTQGLAPDVTNEWENLRFQVSQPAARMFFQATFTFLRRPRYALSFMVTMPLVGPLKAITRQINYKYRLVSRGMSWSSDDSPPRHHRTGASIVNYVYGPTDRHHSVQWWTVIAHLDRHLRRQNS